MSAPAPLRPPKERRPRRRPGYEVTVVDESTAEPDPQAAAAVIGAWLASLPPR
jgi:hypothetical protein